MAKPDTIGNKIAPARFLLFMIILLVATPAAALLIRNWWLGMMAGFDIAALVFLASCGSLLSTREEAEIRRHAVENDANRVGLLIITGTVVAVLLVAITAEVVGRNPQPTTKLLIVADADPGLAVQQHGLCDALCAPRLYEPQPRLRRV